MTKVTMYRTRITFEVLSEEPISDLGIIAIANECDEGDFVMADVERVQVKLDGKEMAEALYAAGSDPNFFNLDADGNKKD